MRAGQLDRRITIQRKALTQSDSGEEVVTWVTIARVWAQKTENRGQERFAAAQFVGHAVRTFAFRWSQTVSRITTEHRLIFRARQWDITDVREIGRRRGIEVDAYTASEQSMINLITFDLTTITFDSTLHTMDAG